MYSGRTAKYVEAMIREGDNFNYQEWLDRVRLEEARQRAAQDAPHGRSSALELSSSESAPRSLVSDKGPKAPTPENDDWHTLRMMGPPVPANKLKDAEPPRGSLQQKLGDVCDAWERFQENRDRDAVYDYLREVFSIVRGYSGGQRTRKLIRRAFKFAGVLLIDMNADPFAVVIRCTCERALDSKTISKWSRALRLVAKFKNPRVRLKAFIKGRGGINACASLWAEHLRSKE